MGQYYMAVLEKDKKVTVLDPFKYENGYKLMEHSYFENAFCNAVMNQLVHNPQKVYWIGDYAEYDDIHERNPLNPISDKKFSALYSKAWNDRTVTFTDGNKENCLYKYIINHTKKRYIDVFEYIKKYSTLEEYHYTNPKGEEYNDIYLLTVNPLPLLTSIGNGKGGGDYYEKYPNANLCGTWAGDVISIDNKAPDGFECFNIGFKETTEEV